jgi:phage terminase large subunit GpA-like protein
MGVDTQGDRLEAYIWAWGRGLERQLVDRQIFYGDPSLPESESGSPWAALTEYRRTPVLHASGRPAPLLSCFIDSGGHHTQAVYSYARSHQHAHVHAIKGASVSGKAILGKPTEQDVNWRGQKQKRGVKLWPIGTDTAKAEIYGHLRISEPGPGYVHLSKLLPADVFDQLTAERLVTRYIKGHAKLDWVKPAGRRNEALDCAVYALAAAHFVGIDRWKEPDWAKWQIRVAEADLFDAPPPPAPEALPIASATSTGPDPVRSSPAPSSPQPAPITTTPAPPPRRSSREW